MYIHRKLRALSNALRRSESPNADDNDPVASAFQLSDDGGGR